MASSSKVHYKLSKEVKSSDSILIHIIVQLLYPCAYINCIKYYNLIRYLECAVSFDKPLAPGVDKLLQALVGLGISLLIAKRCRRVSSFFNKEFASILNNLGKL